MSRSDPGSSMELFRANPVHQVLVTIYAVVWIVTAISPVNRQDWLLENILAIGVVFLLVFTYPHFRFSDGSYVLLTLFLTLHAIGAHYTYAQVPAGFWVQDILTLQRNHFDRLAHFGFGLLLFVPAREIVIRLTPLRGSWTYAVPLAGLMAMSGMFEIIETWVAQVVSPELGDAYLGTQGDIWDAQNDMTCAFVGALLALVTIGVAARHRRATRGRGD